MLHAVLTARQGKNDAALCAESAYSVIALQIARRFVIECRHDRREPTEPTAADTADLHKATGRHVLCDTSTNQSFTRIALFLACIDGKIGTTRLKAIMRKVDDTMKSKP